MSGCEPIYFILNLMYLKACNDSDKLHRSVTRLISQYVLFSFTVYAVCKQRYGNKENGSSLFPDRFSFTEVSLFENFAWKLA